MMFITSVFMESWNLLLDAAVYILFGLFIGGLIKVFLSPTFVANHLGRGKIRSVIKAALFGIPIPLCSCSVLPAAAALKKQGANNGATAAFLISTPESGVDSMAITYALLDPLMTIARPVAAFLSAMVAGVTENLMNLKKHVDANNITNGACTVDACCDGDDCDPTEHARHHSFFEKVVAGLKFAVTGLWNDIAPWFLIGVLIGGTITVLVPDDLATRYLGGGFLTMMVMLAVGVPLYICATASTPIAAALILKGVSPGAALVFLLVGPATNITSLSVLIGLLGKRTTVIYLVTVSLIAVLSGLVLDQVYQSFGISAKAVAGQAAEMVPFWLQLGSGLLLLAMSVRPITLFICKRFRKIKQPHIHCIEQSAAPSPPGPVLNHPRKRPGST